MGRKGLFILSPEERAKIRSQTSYTERFDLLMKLIRISRMLKNVKIYPAKE